MARPKTSRPKADSQTLHKQVYKALDSKKASADSDALLQDLIDVWGGTRRLALDMHRVYSDAPAGGMTRQRILETIQRLIITNTTHSIGTVMKPSDMTDEELDAVAMKYVQKVTQDGPPDAGQEAPGETEASGFSPPATEPGGGLLLSSLGWADHGQCPSRVEERPRVC